MMGGVGEVGVAGVSSVSIGSSFVTFFSVSVPFSKEQFYVRKPS